MFIFCCVDFEKFQDQISVLVKCLFLNILYDTSNNIYPISYQFIRFLIVMISNKCLTVVIVFETVIGSLFFTLN